MLSLSGNTVSLKATYASLFEQSIAKSENIDFPIFSIIENGDTSLTSSLMETDFLSSLLGVFSLLLKIPQPYFCSSRNTPCILVGTALIVFGIIISERSVSIGHVYLFNVPLFVDRLLS